MVSLTPLLLSFIISHRGTFNNSYFSHYYSRSDTVPSPANFINLCTCDFLLSSFLGPQYQVILNKWTLNYKYL